MKNLVLLGIVIVFAFVFWGCSSPEQQAFKKNEVVDMIIDGKLILPDTVELVYDKYADKVRIIGISVPYKSKVTDGVTLNVPLMLYLDSSACPLAEKAKLNSRAIDFSRYSSRNMDGPYPDMEWIPISTSVKNLLDECSFLDIEVLQQKKGDFVIMANNVIKDFYAEPL